MSDLPGSPSILAPEPVTDTTVREALERGADEHFERPAEDGLGRRLSQFLEGDDAREVMANVRSVLLEENGDEETIREVRTDEAVFRIRRASDDGRGLVVIDLAD